MKTLTAALIFLVIASSTAAAQDPFDILHHDLINKIDALGSYSSKDGILLMPDPLPSQLLYDVIHYDITIAVNSSTHQVEGRVLMTLLSLAEGLDRIDIDADEVLNILSVSIPGEPSPIVSRQTDMITVNLSSALLAGEELQIEIIYDGFPADASNRGFYFSSAYGSPVIYTLSQPWSARTWYPCKDYPDDKALFDIAIDVEPDLFAASNGEYIGESDTTHWGSPYKKYRWRENYPMANYLFSLAVSDYVRLDDYFVYAPEETMLVTNYVYPAKVTASLESLNITIPALEFFSSIYGLYPYIDEKYGIAMCSIGGGMEHQTLTSYGDFLVTGGHGYDWVLVHEMAHQWFGDLVTCKDWTHIWLNEGWASYSEALWFEHLGGPDELRSYMESKDNPASWSGPILRSPDSEDPNYYFNSVVYNKAAWVIHMLRHVIGDETFFEATLAYLEDLRFRFSYAETSDFIEIFEDHYGYDLDWFFTPWLTREDRPEYTLIWDSFSEGGSIHLSVAVTQDQEDPYIMPVDLRISTSSGRIDTLLWVDEAEESFHLTLSEPVIDVQLDPDHWILRNLSTVPTGDGDIPLTNLLSRNFPNPFNPSTTIGFSLKEPAGITLRIFDVSGALVYTLASGSFPAGTFQERWNGTNERGEAVASGVYFYRLSSAEFTQTRKMILLR
ncbi:MAG: T9SS type A sorting domain-containing protein [Candidatus Krumholzibacteriota bacterium]|nr:T9SS type A sorting domain-containing protein [Candidatus Krumholzibacteriota bacterium]